MFNTTNQFNHNSIKNSIKINAVSGTLVKNYKESFILRFHANSPMADALLDVEPHTNIKTDIGYKSVPVVILQVMLTGDDCMIAEVMYKSDFDAIFEQPAEIEVDE